MLVSLICFARNVLFEGDTNKYIEQMVTSDANAHTRRNTPMKKALLFAAIIAAVGTLAVYIRFLDQDVSAGPRVAYSSVGDPNPWFLAFSAELEK